MRLSLKEAEFFSSIKAGDVNAVKLALQSEPYLVEYQDEIGSTPLHLAVENVSIEMVELLVSMGAKVEIIDGEGRTPLHVAIGKCLESYSIERDKFIQIATILLQSGADVNSLDKSLLSSLHHAAILGDREIVTFLVKNGANINLRGAKGFTPLHWALCANIETRDIQKHLDVIEALINFGADVTAKTQSGETPLVVSNRYNPGRSQLLQLLKNFGAV
ncbi:MAG: ankyrin repeat domain-containing protein [Anaerolineales bacterium]|nr:MAG: ankyrin repeat domain-containing protein [Anaerolineales bacterium]